MVKEEAAKAEEAQINATRKAVAATMSLLNPLTAAGRGVGALSAAAHSTVAIFDKVSSSVGRFVQASNPAEMDRFRIAVADLSASFGRILEPIIVAGQQVANLFNQFVTGLAPVLGPVVQQLADALVQLAKVVLDAVAPVIEALVPVLSAIMGVFSQVLTAVAPLLVALGQTVADLVTAMMPLLDIILPPLLTVFRALADAVLSVINFFRRLVGLGSLDRGERPDRTGPVTRAATSARQIGIEEIGESARRSAFGGASVVNLMQVQNGLTREQTARVEELVRIGREQGSRSQAFLDAIGRMRGSFGSGTTGTLQSSFFAASVSAWNATN